MAISFVAAGTAAAGTTTATPANPAGIVDGDLIFLIAETINTATIATPSGWTALTGSPLTLTGTRLYVWWRIRSGTYTAPALTTTDHISARQLAYRGVDATTPFDVTPTSTSGTSATMAFAAISPVTANAMIVLLAGRDEDTTSTTQATPGAGFTERADNATNNGAGGGIWAADRTVADAGSFTPTSATAAISSAYVAFTVALRNRPTATLAATLGAATVSATGTVSGRVASLSATLGELTDTGAAQVRVAGQASATLDGLGIAANGTVSDSGVNASASATLGGLGVVATGNVRASNLWTPAQIAAKLLVWLDPDDPSTLTLDPSSNAVATITSRGGTLASASAPTSAARPVRTFSASAQRWALAYDGADDVLRTGTLTWARAGRAAFFVARNDATTLSGFAYLYDSGAGAAFGPYLGKNEDAGAMYVAGGGREPFAQGAIAGGATRNERQLFASTQIAGTNSPLVFWSNGTNVGNVTPTNDGDGVVSPVGIGGAASDPNGSVWLGAIHEVVLFAVELTTTERQLVEGYLAWRHGTVALLPGAHPYKSAAPTIAAGSSGSLARALDPLTGSATGQAAVRATASVTLGELTDAGSGVVAVAGALGSTLSPLLGAGTAFTSARGQLSVTLEPLVCGAAIATTARASVAATLGGLTFTGSGVAPIVATLGSSLGPLSLAGAASAFVGRVASLAATLDPVSLAATGTITGRVASAASVLGALTIAASGQIRAAGSASVTLGELTDTGTALVLVRGSAAATLGGLGIAATGTITTPPALASLASTLGGLSLTGAAAARAAGALAATLDPVAPSATGAVRVASSLSATLGPVTVSGVIALDLGRSGTLTSTLAPLTGSGAAFVVVNATAAPSLRDATLAATTTIPIGGGIAADLAPVAIAASAGVRAAALASLGLGSLTGEATARTTARASLAVVLGELTDTAAGFVVSREDLQAIVVRFGGGAIVSREDPPTITREPRAIVSYLRGPRMTATVRLNARTNADLREVVERRTADDVPVNVTGWTFIFQVRASPLDTNPIIQASSGQGITILNAAAGRVEVFVDRATLNAAMPAGLDQFDGVYDLRATSPAGVDEVWIAGGFTLRAGVSR